MVSLFKSLAIGQRSKWLRKTSIVLGCSVTVFFLGACSQQSDTVTLSSGAAGGYYNRLGKQVIDSASVVNLTVKDVESQGSQQNLQRLLAGETDFALLQLDVATEAMRQGKVQALVVLANEFVHIFTQKDSPIQTIDDLAGKKVAIGTPGSGINFTAKHLFEAAKLNIIADESAMDKAFQKLENREVDAVVYVGNLTTNQNLRDRFISGTSLRLIQIPSTVVNYFKIRDPGAYQPAIVPIGSYHANPPVPVEDLPTLSTSTVLVSRSGVNSQKVALLTWAILANSRKYAPFYPELATGDSASLLQRGLFYLHPAAQKVFVNGDPRDAWLRYLQENKPLQAGATMFLLTSLIGYMLRRWNKEKSEKAIKVTRKAVGELRSLLKEDVDRALKNVEELRQQHRLMLIEGTVTAEIYTQMERMTQILAEQCRSIQQRQHRESLHNTLILVDELQAMLRTNPDKVGEQLRQAQQKYRELLLSEQIDISTYIQLKQLTLISLMNLGTSDLATVANGHSTVNNSEKKPLPSSAG